VPASARGGAGAWQLTAKGRQGGAGGRRMSTVQQWQFDQSVPQ
jgi:hypothetical protein